MSAGTYKITEAHQGRTYTGKHGELVVWKVKLENAQPDTPNGDFELHKKPGNTPQVGDSIEVDRFQQGDFNGEPFVRIFAASQQSAGGSTPSRQSEGPGLQWRSAPYERGAEHPRNEARAIHTSAVSAAPAYYELLRTEGVIDKAESKAAMLNTLSGIVGWLESGYGPVLDAVLAPPPGGGSTAQNGGGEVPADTAELQPAVATVDDTLPF